MKTIFVLSIFLLVAEICLAKKEVSILRLANCAEFKNYTVLFKNVVFRKNNKGKTVASRYEVLFKKEVKGLMIVITVTKCDNSENLDTCEYYMKDFKIKNVCQIITQKNQIWSDTLANSNFPRSCPISAGLYRKNETKVNIDISLMPIPIALWKIKFHVYDTGNENVMVSCIDFHVKVYNVRRKP